MLPLHDDNPTRRTAVLTVVLIVINIAVYFLWQPQGAETLQAQQESVAFAYEHAAVPCEVTSGHPLTAGQARLGCDVDRGAEVFPEKSVWLAVLVSMFLHGGVLHLGGNMLFLWVFGNNVEDRLGRFRFLLFYGISGVLATMAHVALAPDSISPLIGASGAVAGVMGAYLAWFPNARVLTLVSFLVLPIRAKWVLGIWFLSQFFINPNEGVAWAAHVGGFAVGLVFGLVVRGSMALGRRNARSYR